MTAKKLGDKVKADFLQIALKFAAYQKDENSAEISTNFETLEALTSSMSTMTSAVTKMADTLGSKPNLNGLQRLPVPTWDGGRRSYSTWKKEFNHWMAKYGQDKDEQLQRFRNAMPKGSWWTDQVNTCKTIDSAWNILDIEFAGRRKSMDQLLSEVNNLKPVKRDSKSFTQFATTVSCYVNDMEDYGCPVLESTEAPFFMSQLLSKLDPNDNSDFGKEKKKPLATLSTGYIGKPAFDPEARVASSLRRKMKIAETRCPKCQTTMPPMAKKQMIRHVHSVAKPNIISLPVLPTIIHQ